MKKTRYRTIRAAILLGGAALVAAGCGGSDGDGGDSAAVSVDGSSTVFPVMQAVGEEFRAIDGIDSTVGTSGTGGGFDKFCRGETDISNASRPIKDEEIAACADADIEYVELEVALDGLSVVVNPENDWVDCLTLEQLATIWGPDSTVKNWNEVDPSFPDRELPLYGPGTDSGTFDYFTEAVNGEEGASRTKYTASEDDNVLVQGVAGDEGALGYFGYGYVVENEDKVRPIEVDGGDGCVAPTSETIGDGSYAPLSRPLFIYVARDSLDRAEVVDFVDFALANVAELAEDVGFIGLPAERSAAAVTAWDSFRGAEGDAPDATADPNSDPDTTEDPAA
jgi:phosphate transport system substrate-binding protein